VKANWNQQAAKAAGEYLDSQSFSRIGLIRQLEFDGFTASQATYGVNQTGL
jgi:Host cell surface-exposed lipoprotein